MTPLPPRDRLATHVVENQPGPCPVALWTGDAALREGVKASGGQAAPLARLADVLSGEQMQAAARAARRYPPELSLFDAGGRRLDEVSYHPAYHQLMAAGIGGGYAAIAWDGGGGGHVTHAAMVYMLAQVEPGVCTPLTLTHAAVPALSADPALAVAWRPKLLSRHYDPAPARLAEKTGATLGLALAEKQAGSDIGAIATFAEPDGAFYRLTGHKWFCSAPMSDGFLTLAQAPGGLTCFLVPRWLDTGKRNTIQLARLKDTLGNRANATAELEYHGARARRLGPEGEGVRVLLETRLHTRLDTAMLPAGLMRAALSRAVWWCQGRSVFQRRLIDQPLMRAVLADLALDWEGALALGLRAARAIDTSSPEDRGLARVAVALAAFLSNRRAPGVIAECIEALGGMGYVEDSPLPMLYREAPLGGLRDGAGNLVCLDILATLSQDPPAAQGLDAALEAARGYDPRYDTALAAYRGRWRAPPDPAEARLFAERTAVLLTAASLLPAVPAEITDAYLAARLSGDRGQLAGSVTGLDTDAILSRLMLGA